MRRLPQTESFEIAERILIYLMRLNKCNWESAFIKHKGIDLMQGIGIDKKVINIYLERL